MDNLEDVNSLEQAADYLKVTPEKLRRMARTKQVGHIRSGRQYLFTRSALEAYVKAHTVDPLPTGVPPWGLAESSIRRLRQEERKRQGW